MSTQSEKFALARAENKQKEAKIEELHNRLRKMSQDPKFTNEDREEIARQIKKLKSKIPGGSDTLKKKSEIEGIAEKIPGAVKRYKGGLMVKPKSAKRGY